MAGPQHECVSDQQFETAINRPNCVDQLYTQKIEPHYLTVFVKFFILALELLCISRYK